MDQKRNIKESGKRIQAAREYRKMTVKELADKCGIDPKLFEEYEKGTFYPDIEFILLLSKFTNTSIKYLTCFSDDISESSELLEDGSVEQTSKSEVFYHFAKFLDALSRLDSPERKECISKIMKITSEINT